MKNLSFPKIGLLVWLCLVSGFGLLAQSNVQLTATGGTLATNYTTLTAAFNAINAGTHQGTITINLAGNVTESAGTSAVLNSSGAGSASYTSVTIRPSVDGVVLSGTPVTGRGVIELNGADNVTINGDNPNTGGTNRNLTITCATTNTTTYTSVVRLALSTLVTSTNNVTINNCILNGNATGQNISSVTSSTSSAAVSFGILVGSGASTTSATTAPSAIASATTTITTTATCNALSINNNQINTCGRGILVLGASTSFIPTLTITNNIIGNSTAGATDQVYVFGMSLQGFGSGVTASQITGNTVRVEGFIGGTARGIDVGNTSTTTSTNMVIANNNIERVYSNNTGTWGAHGISVSTASTSATTIRNNFIRGLRNDVTSSSGAFGTSFTPAGIRLATGTGFNILHNTVYLSDSCGGAQNLLTSGVLFVSSSVTGCTLQNNLLVNNMRGGGTGSAHVALYLPSALTSAFALTSDNNAYFQGTNSTSGIAQVGTTSGTGFYTSANFNSTSTTPSTNLRAYTSTLGSTSNDGKSLAFNTAAPFVSSTNLHIPAATNTYLESGGATTSVTDDIDGDIRPGPIGSVNGGASKPDIGADEFDGTPIANCTGSPTAGSASSSLTALCASGPNTTSISVSGQSNLPGIDLQWEQASALGGPYSNVSGGSGANAGTYSTPALSSTTYYRCRVICSNSGQSSYTNIITVTVNNPTVLTTTPASRCGDGTLTLNATCNPGDTIVWYNDATTSTILALGNSYTTPVLSATDTLYAAAAGNIQLGSGLARVAPTATTVTTASTYGLVFTANAPMVIKTVDVYPTAAGNVIVALTNSSGTEIIRDTFAVTAGSGTVPQTLTLDFPVPSAGAGYRLLAISSPNMVRESTLGGFPYSLGSFGSVTNGYISGTSTTYYYFYNWSVQSACIGSRVPVIATVTPPPSLTVSAAQTVCNDAVAMIFGSGSFSSFTWSPTTNLFTNPAATVSYAGGNEDTLYFKTSTAGAYAFQVTAVSGVCTNIDTARVTVMPSSISMANPTEVCVSGNRTLSFTPTSNLGSIIWQDSPNNSSWSTISGANSTSYSTPTLTSTTYYRALVLNSQSQVCLNTSDTVIVNNPMVSGTTPGSRCGTGTVTLGATVSSGSTANWYANPSGGSALGSGTSFITPVLTVTDTFYVAASSGSGGSTNVGPVSPTIGTSSSSTITTAQEGYFTVLSDVTIGSVDFFPTATIGSSYSLQFRTSPAGTVLATIPIVSTVTGGATAQTVPVNLSLSPGTYEYGFTTNPGAIRNSAGAVYPYTIPGVLSITGNSFDVNYYYWIYNWSVITGCESSRQAVIATVTPPPAFSINGNATKCPNQVDTLSVTSPLSNFTTYTWSPLSGLFSNSAATSAYTGSNANTVYFKKSTGGTYPIYAMATNGACTAYDTAYVIVTPESAVVTADQQICITGSTDLDLTPSSGYGAGSLQWQSSLNNTTWSDVSGANSTTYTTPVITVTNYYRVLIKNGNGVVCSAPSDTALVIIPTVNSVTGATRCGDGTVSLSATTSFGTTAVWYANPTGGVSIGTGSPFTTPVLTATDTFYVASTTSGGTETVGLAPYTGAGACGTSATTTASDWPLRFNTTDALTLYSATIIPNAAGTYTVALRNALSSSNIQTATFTITSGEIGLPKVLALNFSIPAAGSYQITNTTTNGGYRIGTFSCTYPFVSTDGKFSIVGSATTSTSATNTTTYNLFFNLVVSGGCESNRTPVIATVSTAPAITATNDTSICTGSSITLTASSTTNLYQYTWNPGNITGPSITVSPTSNTTYTVSGLVTLGGNALTGCAESDNVAVTILNKPTAPIVNPAAVSICKDSALTLTVTNPSFEGGGVLAKIGSGTTFSSIPGPYRKFYDGHKMQLLYTAAELATSGMVAGSVTGLSFFVSSVPTNTALGNVTIKLKNTSSTSLTTTFEPGAVTVYSVATYQPVVGTNSHIFNSGSFSWDGVSNILVEFCFNEPGATGSSTSTEYTTITGMATSFPNDNDPTLCNVATGTTTTLRPNVSFIQPNTPAAYTWTPGAGSGLTFNPSTATPATTTYTATATFTNGCSATGNAQVTVVDCGGGVATWLGTTDTLWNTASNWSTGSVPSGCATDVIIPAAARNPVVTTPVSIGNVTMGNNAVLKLNADLSVCGNWNGAGSVTGNAEARFVSTGTNQQYIDSTTVFNNLTVNRPAGRWVRTRPGSRISVVNALRLRSGRMATTGAPITLVSTSGKTAYVDEFSSGFTGSLTGQVVMQRYAPGLGAGATTQHQIATALSSVGVTSSFGSSLSLSGANGAGLLPDLACTGLLSSSPYANLLEFDPTLVTTCLLQGYKTVTSGSTVVGKGYVANVPDNSTLSYRGYYVSGNLSVPVNNTGNVTQNGYNLIGNPYCSPILYASQAGFDANGLVFVPSGDYSGTYQTLTPGSAIASSQGFWVRKSSAGTSTFNFTNAMRTTGSPTWYRSQQGNVVVFEAEVEGYKDLTTVRFNESAGKGWDSEFDAGKLYSIDGRPTLYTVINGEMSALNTLKDMMESPSVSLGVRAKSGASATLRVKEMQLPSGYELLLEDKLTGKFHNLKTNPVYTYQQEESQTMDTRFEVHFRKADTSKEAIHIYSNGNLVNVDFSQLANVNAQIEIYNLTGQLIAKGEMNKAGVWTKEIAATESLMAVVKVNNLGTISSEKVMLNQIK